MAPKAGTKSEGVQLAKSMVDELKQEGGQKVTQKDCYSKLTVRSAKMLDNTFEAEGTGVAIPLRPNAQATKQEDGQYDYEAAKEAMRKEHGLGDYKREPGEENEGDEAKGKAKGKSKKRKKGDDDDDGETQKKKRESGEGSSGGPNAELRKALRELGGLCQKYSQNPEDGDEDNAKKYGFKGGTLMKAAKVIREQFDEQGTTVTNPTTEFKNVKGLGQKTINLADEFLNTGRIDELDRLKEFFGMKQPETNE